MAETKKGAETPGSIWEAVGTGNVSKVEGALVRLSAAVDPLDVLDAVEKALKLAVENRRWAVVAYLAGFLDDEATKHGGDAKSDAGSDPDSEVDESRDDDLSDDESSIIDEIVATQ